jgi:pyruvate/2-oxoglutarate dehydrogenase complex dihydrolipoamide dehydrogenase (E3) component
VDAQGHNEVTGVYERNSARARDSLQKSSQDESRIGITEKEAKEAGQEIKVARFEIKKRG